MPRTFAGSQEPVAGRWAIVVARYNETITGKLLEGAVDTLTTRGVADGDIDVLWVPGAFELPVVAERLAAGRRYRAILCLGAVIRGETTHDQHINRAVSLGLAESARHWGVPVLFGVLTCDSLEQALNRAGGTVGNKGAECASAALEMASLLAQLPS